VSSTASATEVQKNFGVYHDQALSEPAPGLVFNFSRLLLQNPVRHPWAAAGKRHCAGHGRHNLIGNHNCR